MGEAITLWKKAKKDYEDATDQKKPGAMMLKVIKLKSGIEGGLSAVGKAKSGVDGLKAYGALVKLAENYRDVLEKAIAEASDKKIKTATEGLLKALKAAVLKSADELPKPKTVDAALSDKVYLKVVIDKIHEDDFVEFYTKYYKPKKINAKTVGFIYNTFVKEKAPRQLNLPKSLVGPADTLAQNTNFPDLAKYISTKVADRATADFIVGVISNFSDPLATFVKEQHRF